MEKPKRHAVRALYESFLADVKNYADSTALCLPLQEGLRPENLSAWSPQSISAVMPSAHYHCFRGIIKRVCDLYETRNDLHYIMIALPEMGKAYDTMLSSGFDQERFKSEWTKASKPGSISRRIWVHLQALIEVHILCETQGIDLDPTLVFFTRTLFNFFKKAKMECPTENIRKAVHEFIQIEGELREPSGSWSADSWVHQRFYFSNDSHCLGSHPRGQKLWRIVDDVFASIIPMSEVDNLHLNPRHGPGAVADMKSGGDKYLFPTWPSKLNGVFPWCAYAQHREDLHITDETHSILDPKEPPARLIAVPKTLKGPRLIASEPTAHQFLQQGLMRWIRTHMSPPLRIAYDPTSQEPSREAALLASVSGELATVDLSSASDRLSCWTVERALGANQSLLESLHAVRTRCIVDATGTDDLLSLRLKKFAAQGSAVTFPVQTIVYVGFCIAAVLFTSNLPVTRRNVMRVARKVRVFGDDIILPREAVPILSILLDTVQLKVNASKTHTTGHFRESCGMDAYKGYDVTPLYVTQLGQDTSPESIVSWVDVSNNAHNKGLWHLAAKMKDMLPHKVGRLIPTSSYDGDGMRFFTFNNGFVADETKWRYNKHLHRTEYRVICVRSSSKVKSRGSWQDLYQYLIETPDPESNWTAGYLIKNSVKLKTEWVGTY